MTNPNDPAFARPFSKGQRDDVNIYESEGLTKHEWFVGMIAAHMATPTSNGAWNKGDAYFIAENSIAIADALIKELSK